MRKFARDSQRSFSSFVAGDIVLFEYNTLKDDKNSYFVLVVGTSKGNGVFFNSNTKNELMSCFLIDDATDLNTLAAVVDVLHSEAKPDRKDYSSTQGKKIRKLWRKNLMFHRQEFKPYSLKINIELLD